MFCALRRCPNITSMLDWAHAVHPDKSDKKGGRELELHSVK